METTSTTLVIRHDFVHNGVIYSPGQPVPGDLDPAEQDRLIQTGALAVVDETGRATVVIPPEPQDAQAYLHMSDGMVLRSIRRYRPNKWKIKDILAEAERTGRSQLLREALKLRLGLPIGENE